MIRNKYLYGLMAALVWLSACKNDPSQEPVVGGDVPLTLSGLGTRAVGGDLYFTAFTDEPTPELYIAERAITVPAGLSDQPQNLIFTGGSPYYPLGGRTIRLFSYSGRATAGRMTLTAGTTDTHDAVLSNNGIRQNDGAVLAANDGLGTPGSSTDPATVLQYRHVMTKITVTVKVDSTEQPVFVDPPPTLVRFTMNGLVQGGTYSIYAKEPNLSDIGNIELATVTNSALYTLQLGDNYVIPNGTNLDGMRFRSLRIDDYTASSADLNQFTIQYDGTGQTSRLLPGVAYEIIITVRRLGWNGVELRQVPWVPTEIPEEHPSYLAQTLTLDLGPNYSNTGEDAISKVVLKTADRVYVGQSVQGQPGVKFVVLPPSGVDTVQLYTERGLLLTTGITTEYADSLLTLPLSIGGMLPVVPALAYDPVSNPLAVTNAVQFLNVGKDLTASYRQTTAIDMELLSMPAGWQFTGFGPFSGNYDGNDFWISNLELYGSGLFAENTATGILQNIRFYSGFIDASSAAYAGAICGTNSGTIVACINESYFRNATGTVGGICGRNMPGGLLLANLNTGNIGSGTTVGGIVGRNENTAANVIAANVNTGMLNRNATNLGGIVGSSAGTLADDIVQRCFWLVGTAQRSIGGSETAVGAGNIGIVDSSDMDPDKLRNGINTGQDESQRILNRLDDQLSLFPQWYALYEFSLDFAETGVTWPAPVNK